MEQEHFPKIVIVFERIRYILNYILNYFLSARLVSNPAIYFCYFITKRRIHLWNLLGPTTLPFRPSTSPDP